MLLDPRKAASEEGDWRAAGEHAGAAAGSAGWRRRRESCRLPTTAVINLGIANFSGAQLRPRHASTRCKQPTCGARCLRGAEHRETAKAIGNLGMIESYLGE
ncbi:MAG: hypothetical protein IPO66_23200 [Rhodanobacteraceae bacterium]|nr:hypothetical protein [Rhodanobacteraceae bacterium]